MHTLFPPLESHEGSATPTRDEEVMSPELRDNFQTMRELLKEEKKRKDAPQNEEIQAKKLQVALKTAICYESEVSRLRNGIAELEALLAMQEDDVIFPSLPPLIPSEIEVGGESEESSSSIEEKVEGKVVHG